MREEKSLFGEGFGELTEGVVGTFYSVAPAVSARAQPSAVRG